VYGVSGSESESTENKLQCTERACALSLRVLYERAAGMAGEDKQSDERQRRT
jgi:hypothetical protein